MTMHRKFLTKLPHAFIVGMLIVLPCLSPAEAKDTDVYLMSPTVARDDAPNVLIILDNSGSMDTVITNTRPAYDPSINYCTGDLDTLTGISGANAGKPGTCADISGRIYWAFGTNPTPPGMSSDRWFTSSKNYCLDSTSALNTSGFYGSTKIARWYGSGSSSNRNWRTLSGKTDSNITYVDCQADGSTNGQATGDNKYPLSTTSTPAYGTSGTAFNWNTFTSNATPTLYSANYMNYYHNSTLLVTKTRLDVAKDAVKGIIDANKSVRFGLTVFNYNNSTPHGGRMLMRIETMSDARRTTMKNIVDSLSASTYTPLAETMWEAYRYYGGLGVTYGNPSSLQTPHQDSCAQNATSSYCDNGTLYRATNGQYSDSNGAIQSGGTVDASYNDGVYISPFKYGCQTAYIIYVTDGDPTNDSDANSNIVTLKGTNCDGSSCLDDLAGYMHDNDVYSGLPGKQIVNTYTIGFGTGISVAGKALLREAAETDGGGKYYDAEDADQLSSALQGALTEILAANASFTAPSLSINAFNKLYNRDEVYFALFKPSSSTLWDGNMKKYTLCNSSDVTAYGCNYGDVIDSNHADAIDAQTNKIKDTAVSYWDTIEDGPNVTAGGAGGKISVDSAVPRTLYTYRGSYSGLSSTSPATSVATEATTGNSVYDAAVTDPTILGLPSTATSTQVAQLINWMRGQDAYDRDGDGNTTEARSWNFADPLHSKPVTFTFGCVDDDPCTASSTPVTKLFISTNDGMVRIINNSTGQEEWAFMPKEMLDDQYSLSQDADGDHFYGLDDSPVFLTNDIDKDGVIEPSAGDKVFMYLGMRRGGRNIYAFDVTPSATMNDQTDTVTPKLIWVIEGGSGDFSKLGQTWSRPKIARVNAKCTGSVCNDYNSSTDDTSSRMVLILGGGYDINQDNSINPGADSMGNAIYMVNPFTGARVWWASNETGANVNKSNMKYSIPSDVSLVDTNGDALVDRLYVGDTGGQIWRFDLGDDIGVANDGSSGYVFADIGCAGGSRTDDCSATTNQNRRKFFYPPDVGMVSDTTYSSSKYYDMITIASGNREDPLDLLTTDQNPVEEAVHNRIYAIRDYNYRKGAPSPTPSTITESSMYDATADNLGTLTGNELQAEIDAYLKNSKGWYIDLKEASAVALTNGLTTVWVGEKSLAKTIIYGGVLYVTTFVPANDSTAQNTCQANEGEGRYYALNLLTATAAFDLDDDGDTERSTIVGGGIPTEVIIVIRDPGPNGVPGGGGGGDDCKGGVTGMVGASGGSDRVKTDECIQQFKTYWSEE